MSSASFFLAAGGWGLAASNFALDFWLGCAGATGLAVVLRRPFVAAAVFVFAAGRRFASVFFVARAIFFKSLGTSARYVARGSRASLTAPRSHEKVPVVSRLKVQFAHGLESSPHGNKARLFAQHFDAVTPAMDTRDLESCVEVHRAALEVFRPELLIGSSFGGAVVVRLLERGLWRGPTLLLAQAARSYFPECRLPEGVRVTLVHAPEDTVVDIAGSRALAKTGSPELVELIEVHDDHALAKITANGELLRFVQRAVGAL